MMNRTYVRTSGVTEEITIRDNHSEIVGRGIKVHATTHTTSPKDMVRAWIDAGRPKMKLIDVPGVDGKTPECFWVLWIEIADIEISVHDCCRYPNEETAISEWTRRVDGVEEAA